MPIELRILSGTRAGQTESFDKPAISVGRNPGNDLRFDATGDIDVSARHGERVSPSGSRELKDGDVIAFGSHGPTVAVHLGARRATTELVAIAVKQQTRCAARCEQDDYAGADGIEGPLSEDGREARGSPGGDGEAETETQGLGSGV